MQALLAAESTSHELVLLTVDQYHRMLESGTLADGGGVELLP